MSDYIRFIRSHVGKAPILLNFAGGVIRDEDGRVLLQQRGDRAEPVWGFPGGGVEYGESVAETAEREIGEETGLKVQVNGLLGIYSKYFDTHANGDQTQSVTTFFYCTVVSGQLRADGQETLALKYFDLNNLPKLLNQQHEDAARDLRAGKLGVWR